MTSAKKLYDILVEKGKQIRVLQSLSQLLEWDQETYMPEGSLHFRAEQKETLDALAHREFTSKGFEEHLGKLIDLETGHLLHENDLDELQKAAIKLFHKDLIKAKKLPESFVKAFAKTGSETVAVWAEARKSSDFKTFAPYLEKFLALVKEKSSYLGYKEHPYDPLLDEYETDMTVKKLDPLFAELKAFLIPFAKNLSKRKCDTSFLISDYDEKSMFEIDRRILKAMGFDDKTFRLDTSHHPFCTSLNPTDIRMTTVTKTKDLLSANIGSVIHEGGHGLYEAGLDPKQYGTPLGQAVSIAMHESQSKLWECFVGQSKPFWKHFFPQLQELFPSQFKKVNFDTFYEASNAVEPSLIRIYSDEVHYCLHIILRYEIEKALLEGSMQIKDIPDVWNAKMKEYIGITPKNHKEGCMQDIHWAWGLFGYFPTYALGNLYAAQFFDTIQKTFPDHDKRMENGDFLFIKKWLNEHVHHFGRRYSSEELIFRATKQKISPKFFEEYLKHKYL